MQGYSGELRCKGVREKMNNRLNILSQTVYEKDPVYEGGTNLLELTTAAASKLNLGKGESCSEEDKVI